MQPWHKIILILAAAAAAFGWLVWKCDRDPAINFLPNDHRANWIVFPAAPDPRSHRVAPMDATFRRSWTLEQESKSAQLFIRAAKRFELKINGAAVPIEPNANWKKNSILDVSKFFHVGPNEIEVRVFNDDAPPALWLEITADSSTLRTNGQWEASLAGSAWRAAGLAEVPRLPGPGNSLSGGETIFDVLPKIWRTWIILGILSIVLTLAAYWFDRRDVNRDDVDLSRRAIFVLIGVCVLACVILFWNNAKMLPFPCGYDFNDHVAYIKYIQERHALPLPNEGYEMFQPPLFYGLAAGLLSIFRLSTGDDAAVIVLRALTMIFGAANFIFVFLSARLLFPNRHSLQIVATLLAAFLPMQLYLSHYITNETLAGALASATIYLCLRILKSDHASVSEFVTLGAITGAAMLAKATSLLLIPPLIGALAVKLFQERAGASRWFRTFGVTLGALVLVCGWHYLRIWLHFGTPIVGNWDAILGFPWWQDPGFHVAADYSRFGQSLVSPLFSSFNGFADGIYSTLWGDALGGGLSDMSSRTPWNYVLMIGGYRPALLPTLLIITGLAVAIYQFVRRPSAEWFLLLGICAAVLVALIFMTLRVPSYAQVKAFYGLSVVVPLCAFAATGWNILQRTPRSLQLTLGALFVFWALNSYCSIWIRSSAAQHIYAGHRYITGQNFLTARAEAEKAIKSEPSDATAQCFLAAVLYDSGDTAGAREQIERGLQLDPANAECQLQSAINSIKRSELDDALSIAQRLTKSQPENARAWDIAFSCARQLQRTNEAIAIGRDALAIAPYNADLHYRLGLAGGQTADFVTAISHLAYSLSLQPGWTDARTKLQFAAASAISSADGRAQLAALATSGSPVSLNELAWIFATDPDPAVRNAAEAIRLSEHACDLTNRARPDFLITLAAAYAEAGKFPEAVVIAQNALSIAHASGDTKTANLAEDLLISFQANQPYRENSNR